MNGARRLAEGVRAELWFHLYRRTLITVAAIVLGGSLIAFFGSVSGAQAENQHFVSQVQFYAENGVDLADALSSPVTVTEGPDGNQTIDNPLKYDYLEVGRAVHAIDGPVPMLGTILDLLTFIVLPITFVFFGAFCATYDRRAGTIVLRGSRDDWLTLTLAKLGALVVVAIGAVAASTVYALVLGVLGARQARRLVGEEIPYDLVVPDSVSPLAAKLLVSIAVAVFFGVVGYAVGAATNSMSWPMVVCGGLLFLLPFQGAWDPRNLMAVLSADVYDFWGQFSMRPPVPVDAPEAIVALMVYLIVALVLAVVLPRRAKRFR